MPKKKKKEEATQRGIGTCLALMSRARRSLHVFAHFFFEKWDPIATFIQRHFNGEKMSFESRFLHLSVIVILWEI